MNRTGAQGQKPSRSGHQLETLHRELTGLIAGDSAGMTLTARPGTLLRKCQAELLCLFSVWLLPVAPPQPRGSPLSSG